MSLQDLLERIKQAEERLNQIEQTFNDSVERVKNDISSRGIVGTRLIPTPSDYYNWSLTERAKFLGCNESQLCKSIIFENQACDHNNCDDITNSRFYCVIIQYIAKIDTIALRNLIHGLRKPDDRLAKKKFHFQLATEEASFQLSGFSHNAICPFGLLTKIPVVICSRCTEVKPPIIMLGGGKVDLKLSIPISELLKATGTVVGEITELR